MSKYQIIVVVVGIVLIGWLYSLPKSVVKGESEAEGSKVPEASSSAHSSADSLKAENPSKDVSLEIKSYQKEFRSATDITTKASIADSLASIYKRSRSFDSAAYYKKIVAELLPSKGTLESLADAYSEAANFSSDPEKVKSFSEESRKYYEEVLKSAPDDLNVKSKVAMTYISSEDPMAGIKMLREVVEKDPNNELAVFNLGILSLQSNQHRKAAQRFEKLVKLNPNHWKGRFYLAITYNELGKKDEAREQFELVKKLEHDPEVVATVNNYLEEMSR